MAILQKAVARGRAHLIKDRSHNSTKMLKKASNLTVWSIYQVFNRLVWNEQACEIAKKRVKAKWISAHTLQQS